MASGAIEQRERYRQRRAVNQCVDCTAPAFGRFRRCEFHLDKQLASFHRRKKQQ